jgi:chemotaxis protein methyltransferase CheR
MRERSHVPEAALDRVAHLLHRRIGLRPEPAFRSRLRRCVRDDAAARGMDIETYTTSSLEQAEVLQSLVNRVTVQETAFFRHPEHFDVLARDILPALVAPVIVWSAGCANGQEAFSLAMLLDELGIDGSVIATDLSTAAVQRATGARYTTQELTGLSPERIDRHLTRADGRWQINHALQERVTIARHNLLDGIPPQALSSQVVFCRNVLIYFAPDHARALVDGVADTLPSAALFLGSAEAIWPLSDRFETVHMEGTFFYRPRAKRPPITSDARCRVTVKHHPADQPTAPANPRIARRSRRQPTPPPAAPATLATESEIERLSITGQQAVAAGDYPAAVTAFRKCAYLAPDQPLGHLHLGLALEAAGDLGAAQRAYAAARHAVLDWDPSQLEIAAEGYTSSDLLRLLDTKLQVLTR